MSRQMDIVVRRARTDDAAFILRANADNVEVLAPLDARGLAFFEANAELLQVAEADGAPAAFLVALREGVDAYPSENYRWFSARYPKFLYVDRIVVDEPFRKLGLGRRLYEGVVAHARATGVPTVTAEVDTAPVYNAASLAFHARMGFREVGTQTVRDGTVEVSLQALDV